MNSGTGLNILQKAMPDRYFDVGIAEQQALLFAAGLAIQGSRPVAAIYSTFLQRAFDQIVHDVCLQSLPVVLAMDRAGLVGDDGPTHHGVFDIAYLRPLPNMTLMAPRDEAMLVHMLHTALRHDAGPVALRYPRGEAVGVPLPVQPERIPIGTGRAPARGRARGHRRLRHRRAGRRSAPRTCWRRAAWTSRSPTRASPSRSTRSCSPGSPRSTTCSSPWRRASWPAASAARCGSRSPTAARAPRILRVGLPDAYVTHGAPKLLHAEVGYTAEHVAERIQAAVLDPRGSLASAVSRCSARTSSERVATSARPADSTPCSPSAACTRPARAPRRRCIAGDVHLGAGRLRAQKPGQLVRRGRARSTSRSRRRTCRAEGSSWRTRSTRSGSRSPAAARSTSAPRPAGSRTACCSAGPRTWSRSTSPTGSSRWRCATDERVTVIERVNARAVDPALLPYAPDLVVADVSFISLTKVLPAVLACCAPRFDALVMVKPQFEVGRGRIGKGGVVTDPALRREAIVAVAGAAQAEGAAVLGFASSGLPGPAGNRETFAWLAEGGRAGGGGRPRGRGARRWSRDRHRAHAPAGERHRGRARLPPRRRAARGRDAALRRRGDLQARARAGPDELRSTRRSRSRSTSAS